MNLDNKKEMKSDNASEVYTTKISYSLFFAEHLADLDVY